VLTKALTGPIFQWLKLCRVKRTQFQPLKNNPVMLDVRAKKKEKEKCTKEAVYVVIFALK